MFCSRGGWNGYVVCDHNQLELCLQHIVVKSITFQSQHEHSLKPSGNASTQLYFAEVNPKSNRI